MCEKERERERKSDKKRKRAIRVARFRFLRGMLGRDEWRETGIHIEKERSRIRFLLRAARRSLRLFTCKFHASATIFFILLPAATVVATAAMLLLVKVGVA